MTTTTDQTTYAGQIIILRCWCGIRHGVPTELRDEQLRIHSPLGHTHVPAGRTETDKLRDQLQRTRESEEWYRHQAALEARRAAAARGQLTKLRNRVANGLCPKAGCKRSFTNLHDHVRNEHPELRHALEDHA